MKDDVSNRNEAAFQAYCDAFDNSDEVFHPQLLEESEYAAFILAAVAAGKPLTQADVEAKFGPVAWDW